MRYELKCEKNPFLKKKIITFCVCLAVIAALLVGGFFAYKTFFPKEVKEETHVFEVEKPKTETPIKQSRKALFARCAAMFTRATPCLRIMYAPFASTVRRILSR